MGKLRWYIVLVKPLPCTYYHRPLSTTGSLSLSLAVAVSVQQLQPQHVCCYNVHL